MRGVIYVRVSTDEQAQQGFSLAAQEELCRERAITDGCAPIEVFVDDGYSAATLDRPALKRLLHSIRKGDTIYVYRLDRLSRDVEHMALLLKTFQAKSIDIRPIVGSADVSTSLGRAFTNMQAVWAQLEREQLGERVSMGMRKRVAEGKTYSRVPFGLISVDGSWQINESEAPAIRRAFELRAGGYGLPTICRIMAEEGYLTRSERPWGGRAIWHILQNPAYVGDLKFGDIERQDAIPAIISRELWETVQTLNTTRRKSRVRTESRYLLSGLVYCQCGRTMGGYVQRTYKRKVDGKYLAYPVYRCIGKASTPATDHNNAVSMRKLDELVIDNLLTLRNSSSVKFAVPTLRRKQDDSELRDLLRQLDALETALLSGRITGERYDVHKNRLDLAIAEAKSRLSAANDEQLSQAELAARIKAILPTDTLDMYRIHGSTPQLKSRIMTLIERIEVSLPDGKKQGLDSRKITIRLRPI